MEFLNIEQQVQKNKEDIKKLRSGIKIEIYCNSLAQLTSVTTEENVGKYVLVSILQAKRLYLIARSIGGTVTAVDLGLFPAVVQGEKGDKGDDGTNGERGSNIIGVSVFPPSDAREGDYYIQKKIVDGSTDYILNKRIGGSWYPQFSMRGNQGLPGVSEQTVIPNPVGAPTDVLNKIDINGTIYELSNPYKYIITVDGSGVHFEELSEGEDYAYHNDVKFDNNIKIDSIEQLTNLQGEAYFNDTDYSRLMYISTLFRSTGDGARVTKDLAFAGGEKVKLQDEFKITDLNGNPLYALQNLKDYTGNNRFVEGEIEINTEFFSPSEVIYHKWSLSGTHLQLVFVFALTTTSSLSGRNIGSVTFPQYIADKLIPMTGSSHIAVVSGIKGIMPYNLEESTGTNRAYLLKDTATRFDINMLGDDSEPGKFYRVEFNLIVDND